MAYNELLQSMEISAQDKINESLSAARMAAEDLIRDARRESEEIKNRLIFEAAGAVAIERNRVLYLLREELKSEETREKEDIYLEVFEKAGKATISVREDPRYPESFVRMLVETLEGVQSKALEIHIDPRDEEICRHAQERTGARFPIISDLQTAGGQILRNSDGRITIDNTLESRFDRARDVLKKEIYSILFGE